MLISGFIVGWEVCSWISVCSLEYQSVCWMSVSFFFLIFLAYMLKGESFLVLEARGMRGQREIFLGIHQRYGEGQGEASSGFYSSARGNWENQIWANR